MNASEHMERVFSNGRNNLIRECMKHGERFCIEGPPGIGKTEEIKYEAARAGYEMYTNVNGKLLSTVWRMVRKERPDLQGAMVPDLVSGVTRELPLESLFALRNLPPDQKVCLFLDDYGQCPDDVQASGMGLFDENELPPNVLICAATNRIEDGAAVKGMISPMRSRFAAIFRVATPDVTDLTEGAAT